MIIKCRSPSKRDVSRTHRVAPDWLFDRINVGPQVHIKYVDTKHQLADILTKDNFICETSVIAAYFAAQNFSLTSCTETMATRMQEQEGEERIVAKSKPTMNLVSLLSTSSSTVQNPTASKRQVILTAPCRKDWSNTGKLEAKITHSRRIVECSRMAHRCISGCEF